MIATVQTIGKFAVFFLVGQLVALATTSTNTHASNDPDSSMTRAINPTGSMLLDRSSAHPGSIDKSIFENKSGSSSGGTARTGSQQAASQGTVNPNYLRECREDNPEPAPTDGQTESVVLVNCKITTPPENLVVDQPFDMSVEAKTANGPASGQAMFRLFCAIPDSAGGPPKCEDQSLSFSGKITDGVAKASGKLISPKKPVAAGTKLQYHVVAEHLEAKEKCESPKVEVEAGKPPKPVAVWSLGAVHFGFDSSFILPSAAAKIAEFKDVIAKHPGAAVAVFGHADPVGEDDNNKGLSGRRAFAVWCLLAKDPTGWTQLSSTDKWDLRTTQTMLSHLKDKATGAPYYGGSVDGKTGPKTESAIKAFRNDHTLGNGSSLDGQAKEGLFKAYMDAVCEVTCKPEDFVGDPKDTKRQWACVGCSEFNPVLVFGKSDDARFRNASDKTERNNKNAPNRRATVLLFPPGAKGPGNVEFPCPQWSEGVSACRKQLFEDADKRRNPSDAERTWEKDKDTFACKFYAGLGEGRAVDPIPPASVDGAYWENGDAPAKQGEVRKMSFRSEGMPAGESVSFAVYQAIPGKSPRRTISVSSISMAGLAEANFCDWYNPELVEPSATGSLPEVGFHFEAACAGRQAKSGLLPFSDELRVEFKFANSDHPAANRNCKIFTPWGIVDRKTDDAGILTIDGLPPGGAKSMLVDE